MINTSARVKEVKPLGKIAHYTLVRKIGQGGMSAVYEAFDERLKRPVALKLLHPFLAEMPEYRARFFREAQACARLAHPNILQIFDVSSSESTPDLYIATELLSGGTLKERAPELNTFLLPELGAMIIAQVAHALEHAHQKGIIHRDIKPENIMLTNEGQIKLMDFGIASIGSEESLTQSGTLLGSLAHVAPEVVKGNKASAQSDIFSLATVFYWLLTQKLPFNADSPHALLKAIADSPAEKPQKLSPYICDDLAAIIEQGMSKDPQMRFSSATAFAEAIESALLTLGLSPDTKKLTAVLSRPAEEFGPFKENLLSMISLQQKAYENLGQHQEALALKCRLDVEEPSRRCEKKSKKITPMAFAFFSLSTLAVCALGLFFHKISAQKLGQKPSLPNSDFQSDVPLLAPIAFVPEQRIEHEAPVVLAKEEPVRNASANKIIKQELNIIIWPFANVFVDGKLVAKDTKHVRLSLSEGPHRVIFTHTYAATIEKNLVITSEKKPEDLLITMAKSKPAFLMVKANINADVTIGGNFKGSTEKSIRRPIVIPIPDKAHALKQEVIIQHDGYEPFILTTEFIAGQTKILPIKLVPLVNARIGN